MNKITVTPLSDDLAFGSRITGLSAAALADESVREELRQVFEARGLILFEGVEPSSALQIETSKVFGPLKEHPVKAVDIVDPDVTPGLMKVELDPKTCDIVEIEGTAYSNWLPWHFDHCYNNELMRGGVLRNVKIANNGGQTGFMDGIDIYNNMPADLRERIEGLSVVYTLDMHLDHMRFGKPATFVYVQEDPVMLEILEQAKSYPRAIHPAVWTRPSGEKIFHVSGWMAVGLEGHEDAEGDALLEDVCQEINRLGQSRAYFHQWKPTDMMIWDNWRMLHSVTGCTPPQERTILRSTIRGDYGLGRFENDDRGRYALLERSV